MDGSGTWPPPTLSYGMNFKDFGSYGLRQYSGWVREEFLGALVGREAARVYREMIDNSATVGSMMFAIIQAMRRVEWRVEAPGDSDKSTAEVKFVESLKDDMCYDPETEILTKRGWRRFEELESGDLVAQRNADGMLEFVKPTQIHEFDFDGELMGYCGDAVDFLVTPNHRMLFAPRTGRKHDKTQKHDLGIHQCEDIFGKSGWVSKKVEWTGERSPYDRHWLEFLGFFVAEGYASDRNFVVVQKDTDYVEDLISRNSGARLCGHVGRRQVNGSTQWQWSNAALARELRGDFGTTSRFKKLPQWLKDSTPDELRAFLTGFAAGDGWFADSGLIGLYTSSQQLADDLQEIALKAGYIATLLCREQTTGFAPGANQYRVSIWSSAKDHDFPYLHHGRGWYKRPHCGKVHCVSVPSGVVLVRRDGKSLWCGNSHTWSDFIAEALSMLGYGYCVNEIVYKRRLGRDRPSAPGGNGAYDPSVGKFAPQAHPEEEQPPSQFSDGRIGWRRLPIRGQETILKWFFDSNGQIKGVTQQPWVGQLIDIPVEKFLLFRPTAHKNNPEGKSILRNAYRSYWFVKRLEEIEAILFERMSGFPVMYVPNSLLEGATANNPTAQAALAYYKNLVTNVRINEQMGAVLPSDVWLDADGKPSSVRMFEFQLLTPQHGSRSVTMDATIERHKLDMLMTTLADFIKLGHEVRGTNNLAVTRVDMFYAAIEGWLTAIADVLNRYAVPRVWKINALPPDTMPQFKPDMPDRIDLDGLGGYIANLAKAGMPLFPDEELQEYIRGAAGLPEVTSPEATAALAAANAGGGDAGDTIKRMLRAAVAKKIRESSVRKQAIRES